MLLATGIVDEIPNIKGFAECWGKTVIHCPYCHGYEFNGQVVGILSQGDKAFHVASLVNNLNPNLTLITAGKHHFKDSQLRILTQNQININENTIQEIVHDHGNLSRVVFTDGSYLNLKALYATLPFSQHSTISSQLGCAINEQGLLEIDVLQQTTVPGVFACGDNCSAMRSIANAVAAGNLSGAVINKMLTQVKGF